MKLFCNATKLSVPFVIYLTLFQRVHLDIQVGEHAVDYAHVAQKEKLSELQLRVRQLLDQTEQIAKEQNYQRVKKKIFYFRQKIGMSSSTSKQKSCSAY
jgi:emp24/gp25L/p24 family/GOLD